MRWHVFAFIQFSIIRHLGLCVCVFWVALISTAWDSIYGLKNYETLESIRQKITRQINKNTNTQQTLLFARAIQHHSIIKMKYHEKQIFQPNLINLSLTFSIFLFVAGKKKIGVLYFRSGCYFWLLLFSIIFILHHFFLCVSDIFVCLDCGIAMWCCYFCRLDFIYVFQFAAAIHI